MIQTYLKEEAKTARKASEAGLTRQALQFIINT